MTMAASTSTAYPYDVFISGGRPDVKKTFINHLYNRLASFGLRAFLDYNSQDFFRRDNSQDLNAIGSAAINVAVFSPRYAASQYCLDELLFMLESGAPIIPVFYGVKPADLRWTRVNPKLSWARVKNGVYTQALDNLEKERTYDSQPRYNSTTMEKWRNALLCVADMSGLDREAFNGDDGELIDGLVELVLRKVPRRRLHVATYATGLDKKVEEFESRILQQQHSGRSQVVGIAGLGGVGKTTLAKEIFNRKRLNYSRYLFLCDIRETEQRRSSLLSLQKQLLKGLLGSDMHIVNKDQGIEMLRTHLPSYQVLVVLDDVDHVDQVDALLPLDVLHHDSLILITSRDKHILARSGVPESCIYELTGLNREHSRELFCLFAFHQRHPLRGFEHLVDQFLMACNGLPLSLRVIGALLYGKDESYWQHQLNKITPILPSDIKRRLHISYDTLADDEKQFFLDIAHFFIGENRDTALRIWSGSRLEGLKVFRSLENKFLVQVDEANKIRMHDHLRDMGREIGKRSMGREIGQQSFPHRFWCGLKDVNVFFKQAFTVRGIRMLARDYKDGDNEVALNKMRGLQLLDSEDDLVKRVLQSVQSPNLLWLRWHKCPYSSLPSWILMEELRVLEVHGNKLETLWQRAQVPLNLRELKVTAPLSKFPKMIGKLEHLERIYFNLRRENNVTTMPGEFCNLQSLTALELLWCRKMKSLPYSFGNLTNLERIDLSGSVQLERLPNSFGNLKNLKYLKLYKCTNLTISSETLGNIGTLKYLDLRFCEKIEVLPPQIANQESLEKLYLGGTNLKELPRSIGYLFNLDVLEVGSPSLETLPPSLGDLRNLRELKLLKCQELKFLPDSVGLLTQLTNLSICDCPLRELPFDGETETSTELSLPGLQHLTMSCTKISEVSFAKGVCPDLQSLYIEYCDHLVDVGTLPNGLIKLRLSNCSNLRNIKGLCGLAQLRTLHIGRCEVVEELLVENLASLVELRAYECVELNCIQGLGHLTRLRLVDVTKCFKLKELPGVEHSMSLEVLRASGCSKLQWGEGVVEKLRQRLKEFLYGGKKGKKHGLHC